MNIEIWKTVPEYEGLYEVSNYGRVRSLDRIDSIGRKRKGRILKAADNGDGYYVVNLSKNNKQHMYLVHRLVAEVFIPNPNNLPCINHKDENTMNNFPGNLEWCDKRYNNNYGTKNIRAAEKLGRPILQLTPDGVVVMRWNSAKECQRKTGMSQGYISGYLRGEYNNLPYGFRWEYDKDDCFS